MKATLFVIESFTERHLHRFANRDVAQFAVVSLASPAALNTTIEIGGPESLSQVQIVRLFEDLGGRPFEMQHVPEAALMEQLQTATDPMQQSFTGLMQWYARGDAIDMEKTPEAFPMQLTSVRDYARSVLSAS